MCYDNSIIHIGALFQKGVCDLLVAVYDPELTSDSAEDKAMAYALALGKPTLLIHPNTWKKKWLNVVKREGE